MSLKIFPEKISDQNSSGFIKYTQSLIGAVRTCMLIRAISVLYNETVKAPSEIASQIKDTMSGTLSGLGIIALPAVTGDAIHQIAKLGEPDFGPQGRKTAVAFRSVMDAVSFWANTGAFFAASPALKGVAKIADLNKNISDLGISWNDYNQSLIYENASSGEAREAFAHTRKYNMLRIAKAVISISTAFFAVWMILMGFAIVPTMITAILSLAAAAIAIRRDLYKDEGRFELANLTHLYTIGEHQRVS